MSETINKSSIPLHLHTLDSLLKDIISGRSVSVGNDNEPFSISGKGARAILNWFCEDRRRWSGNANDEDCWSLVKARESEFDEYPEFSGSKGQIEKPSYRFKMLRAHHFAGLHQYDEQNDTQDVKYDLSSDTTLFEGKNGSGKTSLLNAAIWCLTGKILRSQQEPKIGETEIEVKTGEEEDQIIAKSVAVSPVPPENIVKKYKGKFIPIDTCVEMEVAGKNRNYIIRRRIYNNNKHNKPKECNNLSELPLLPTAFEVGTVMPGMIPTIQFGQANDIGKAISKLTGFDDLREISRRARLLGQRITNKIVKNIETDIEKRKENLLEEWELLYSEVHENNTLFGKDGVCLLTENCPTKDKQFEEIGIHINEEQRNAFEEAKKLLGAEFDPSSPPLRDELIQDVGKALGFIDQQEISNLDSVKYLVNLKSLTDENIAKAQGIIAGLLKEYKQLTELAKNPSRAARERLYARVVNWINEAETGDPQSYLEKCALCDTNLEGKYDPVAESLVRDRLQERLENPSLILAFTLETWRDHAEDCLARDLPDVFRKELDKDLPKKPADLMLNALGDELFKKQAFQGSLAALKPKVDAAYNEALNKLPAFQELKLFTFPTGFETRFNELALKFRRVQRAISFARWRREYSGDWGVFINEILGEERQPKEKRDHPSLLSMIFTLKEIVDNAKPIQQCSSKIANLRSKLALISKEKEEVQNLTDTANDIKPLLKLGDLVDRHMETLRNVLHKETVEWKNSLYFQPAGTAPHHAETHVSPKGELEFSSETEGTRVLSQHISNSSDMRATLFAFLIAFWKHVRDARGGFDLLVLDDPQELFDRENQRKLLQVLRKLTGEEKGQLLISSYDSRFSDQFSRNMQKSGDIDFSRYQISPANKNRPFVELPLAESELNRKQKKYRNPKDGEENSASKDYVNELRIYIETRLSECFPERTVNLSDDDTIGPYIQFIRHFAKSNTQPFSTPPFQNISDNKVFADGSDVLEILNRSHHKNADTISRNEVKDLESDLNKAKSLVDEAHMAFDIYCMGGQAAQAAGKRPKLNVDPPEPITLSSFSVPVYLDLAAFTSTPVTEMGGDTAEYPLTEDAFREKALYRLNTHNFGFAAWRGCIAVVESKPGFVENNRLVIARYRNKHIAGRLLRDSDGMGRISISSEETNPLSRSEPRFLFEDAAELHKVIGIIFQYDSLTGLREQAIGDVAPIDHWPIGKDDIQVGFKVRDGSAIPIALGKQIAIGGKNLPPIELKEREGRLVAISTSDGQQLFKRIGGPVSPVYEDIRLFESIGGHGDSIVLALAENVKDQIPHITSARLITGVLYNSP